MPLAHGSSVPVVALLSSQIWRKSILDISRDGYSRRIALGTWRLVGILEIKVVGQRAGPVFRHGVVVRNFGHVEPLIDGSVHGSVAELVVLHSRQFPGGLVPRDAKEIRNGAEAGFYLVVLDPRWVGVKAQYTPVVLHPVGNCVGASKHPFEGGVRKSRFIFWVAAADVGVVPGKPDLLEGEVVEFVARGASVGNAPFDPGEILSVLID